MLSQTEIDTYNRVGAIVVPDVLSRAEIAELSAVTDDFVARARGLTEHTDIYDLEDSHTKDQPRVRRIKAAHQHHPVYAALTRHPRILAVLADLWGPDLRFDTAKLNMKCAGFGASVEWHQDWAFYPHTNDDILAIGVLLDDTTEANGPLLCVPGTHTGPVWNHHGGDGRFAGMIDPADIAPEIGRAVALTGRAGTMSFHHVRTLHGSAENRSERSRNLLLYEVAAADAWPLRGVSDLDEFDARLLAGAGPTIAPRLAPVPVRVPLPPPAGLGSIYETQARANARSYFRARPAA